MARPTRITLKSGAFHEAGHAVIARVMGLTCGAAAIIPDIGNNVGDYAMIDDPVTVTGHWYERGRYRKGRTAYRGRILANMAGAETEKELLGWHPGGDDDDRRRILLVLEAAELDEKWDRCEPRMRALTRQLVRRHRAKIERVARALLKRRMLQGDEIDALLTE